jgi:hypothetical protein
VSCYKIAFIPAIIKIMSKIKSQNTRAPQNGANTHHHDQVIVPVSLRTIKTIPNIPKILIPELDELELLILI